MKHAMRRLTGAAGIALAATLAIAPAASASTDDPDDHKPAKPAGVVLAPQPLVGIRIAIDPGHGGQATDAEHADTDPDSEEVPDGRGGRTPCTTPGSVSPEGYTEHEFTYEVSQKLAEQLRDRGAIVVLTREADDGAGPCVDDRGTFALDRDVDLMLSIHSDDSAPAEDAESAGDTVSAARQTQFQVVIAAPPQSDSQRAPSHDLAESMASALEDAGYAPQVDDAESADAESADAESADDSAHGTAPTAAQPDAAHQDRPLPEGVTERADVTTLNFARRPAVQVELGDLREGDQAQIMRTDEAQDGYAEALTAGVLDWVSGHRLLTQLR